MARTGTGARVRLRSAPAYDPPYDDERPPDWWGATVQQPLLELSTPPPAASLPPPAGQPADSSPAGTPAAGSPPAPPPAPAVPHPTTVAAVRFVNTCLEIFNGYRPVGHFRVLASPLTASTVVEAMTYAVRRLRRTIPRAGDRDAKVKLRQMRTCAPRPEVAEIAVVIGAGSTDRVWALAFRIERQQGRWLCTAARLL